MNTIKRFGIYVVMTLVAFVIIGGCVFYFCNQVNLEGYWVAKDVGERKSTVTLCFSKEEQETVAIKVEDKRLDSPHTYIGRYYLIDNQRLVITFAGEVFTLDISCKANILTLYNIDTQQLIIFDKKPIDKRADMGLGQG